jgi:hypothetical protein
MQQQAAAEKAGASMAKRRAETERLLIETRLAPADPLVNRENRRRALRNYCCVESIGIDMVVSAGAAIMAESAGIAEESVVMVVESVFIAVESTAIVDESLDAL